MDAFFVMLRNIVVFLLLAVPGFILVKTKILKEEESGGLSKILMYVGLPFLAFTGTVDKLTLNEEMIVLVIATFLIGIAYTFFLFFVTKPLTAMEKNDKTRSVLRFSAAFSNNGFLGIPLAMAVFGDGRALTFVIVLNIVTNVLMYTLGTYLVGGGKEHMDFKKAFLNPVLIAFLIGLVVNALNLKQYVPEISTYSAYFSNIVAPLSMIVVGVKLGSIPVKTLFGNPKMYYVSFLKLILCPAVIVGLLLLEKLIFPASILDRDMVLAFFIAFAMPTAGLAPTFAYRFHSDADTAASCTLGSTIFAVVTIPLLFAAVNALI